MSEHLGNVRARDLPRVRVKVHNIGQFCVRESLAFEFRVRVSEGEVRVSEENFCLFCLFDGVHDNVEEGFGLIMRFDWALGEVLLKSAIREEVV